VDDLTIGESAGIRVRMLHPDDLAQLERWFQPDQEWHLWDGPYFPKMTSTQIGEWMTRLAGELADGSLNAQPPVRRAVVVRADTPDAVVGSVSWHWESEASDWRRVGLTVYDPATRGHGVGTEALRIWTDYLFAVTDIVRLDYSTWSGNTRMIGVGRKLGYTEEARFRDAREVRGERYDSIVMGILRREWEAREPTHRTVAHSSRSAR